MIHAKANSGFQGCFFRRRTKMAFFRQKQCIVYSLLVFGCIFILSRLFPGEAFSFLSDNLKVGTQVLFIKESLVANDSENERYKMLLLLPQRDESHFLDNQIIRPQIFKQLLMRNGGSQEVVKPLDTDAKLLGIHKKEWSPEKHLDINLTESLENQYFKDIQPRIKSVSDESNRVQVLILTNRRSGSTFLGEFFNQNPHTFFQYEPLKLPEQTGGDFPQFLHHVMKCEFDRTPDLVEYWNREYNLRLNNKAMVEPPLCNLKSVSLDTSHPLKKTQCQPLKLSSFTNVCHSKQYLVSKLIRLQSISSLEPLSIDPDINLKIIHLVRDPRAIYTSRAKIPSAHLPMKLGEKLDHDMKYLCRRIGSNLNFIRSQPAWIQGKYKLVRYEDIASHPAELAQDVYDFTGMGPLPSEVQEWIQTNTNHTSEHGRDIFYSTSRVSAQMPEAWRSEIPIEIVLRMQTFCQDAMRELGYLEVNSEEELLNKNKSLVVQLPRAK